MKLVLTVALFSAALTSGALAQQSVPQPAEVATPAQTGPDAPASKEDVEAYLQVTHAREMTAKMVDAMVKPMHQMLHEEYLKNKDKLPADFEARTNKQLDELLKDMPFDEMFDAMVPSYQKHFTKGDLNALVTFYSSPTGQKILNQMPQIMAEAMQSMMPIMQKYMVTVQQHMQEEVAQMLKQAAPRGEKTAPPSAN
jgi:hypothetical protein